MEPSVHKTPPIQTILTHHTMNSRKKTSRKKPAKKLAEKARKKAGQKTAHSNKIKKGKGRQKGDQNGWVTQAVLSRLGDPKDKQQTCARKLAKRAEKKARKPKNGKSAKSKKDKERKAPKDAAYPELEQSAQHEVLRRVTAKDGYRSKTHQSS